jgi:acetyltransferase
MHPEIKGNRCAVVTHAGGPAVMLTDVLSNGGMEVPSLKEHPASKALLEKLFPGSSVGNPIDFLATGTAEQLGYILDAVENDYTDIDFSVVIFGSPGLFSNKEVYDLLDQKMHTCKKPIFPVLPSIINVKEEIEDFIAKGRINFPEECVLGNAICKVYNTPKPQPENVEMPKIDTVRIRKCIDSCENGYIGPDKIYELLDAAGIAQKQIRVVDKKQQALDFANEVGYPLVMKVVGPVHKSDVGGVTLNVRDIETVGKEFDRLMAIKDTYAVEMYPMLDGTEVYIGAIRDAKFGHQVFFGLGGIFIEVLKDVQSSLVPISAAEAKEALTKLRGYKILQGVRGQQPVNVDVYAEQIARVAALVMAAPEIAEMDLNPLLGNPKNVVAVDARIRIEK